MNRINFMFFCNCTILIGNLIICDISVRRSYSVNYTVYAGDNFQMLLMPASVFFM